MVLALLTVSVFTACSGGGADERAAAQRRLDAVMVGSDRDLSERATGLVDIMALELTTLAVPLRVWWETVDDPDTTTARWLAQAPGLLAQMQTIVDRVEDRALSAETESVRDTFVAYVREWRVALRALDAVRGAVARDDAVARATATAEYDASLGRIRVLDRARVERVVAAYGADDARRLLTQEGLDPTQFGL
jgi:hypothetical protein